MNYPEQIPQRPVYSSNEVVEWTDHKQAILDDGSVVRRDQIDHGNHWTAYENGTLILDAEAVAVIRAIEVAVAVGSERPIEHVQ